MRTKLFTLIIRILIVLGAFAFLSLPATLGVLR